MSTWSFWMNGSRLAETVSVHSMLSNGMPSSLATICRDLDVEALRHVAGAEQAEQRLVELGADA